MIRPIYHYEIELRVKGPNGSHIETQLQHAYSVVDAVHQAVMMPRDGSVEAVLRVGPPEAEIRRQSEEIEQAIAERMAQLARVR